MNYIVITLLIFSITGIFLLLEFIDKKIDYEIKGIRYTFYSDNGFYIRVPYLNWQRNKKKVIEEIFAEEVCYEGKTYITTAIFKERQHLQQTIDLLPAFFRRDYVAHLELKKENSIKSIINNTQIIGNYNSVNIEQNEINKIINSIDNLISYEISDVDKQCLELFKYKLKHNDINETDKKRIISVLDKLSKFAPYASLASSVINLIKSLLP